MVPAGPGGGSRGGTRRGPGDHGPPRQAAAGYGSGVVYAKLTGCRLVHEGNEGFYSEQALGNLGGLLITSTGAIDHNQRVQPLLGARRRLLRLRQRERSLGSASLLDKRRKREASPTERAADGGETRPAGLQSV